MKITTQEHTVPRILVRLAEQLGTELKQGRLEIPARYGRGYCAGFVFNAHLRLLISNYELHDDIVVENPEIDPSKKTIFFKFQHIFPGAAKERTPAATPAVLIGTSRVNTDEAIAVHSNTGVINIEVDADYLNGLFDLPEDHTVLQSLLENSQPLLFEQLIYPALQAIIDALIEQAVDDKFRRFFLRIKTEELICHLLMALEQRDSQHLYPLNSEDISTIYRLRDQLLARLDDPPVIADLAATSNMSPSKLKRLFRQIFGESIFTYYQAFRMKEAARLLREEKLSVTETGYRLGFTNLSHFTRVFEKHTGIKPKKYSAL
ncbi:AraC family transcriptional regulator [Chitinophaga sp.]|uniref:helix-turn-helix transcriptional regulator n=1 Tax=Chitinophaga sp. TaxID=1869181 RepID=UPI0031E36318